MVRGKSPNVQNQKRDSFIPDLKATKSKISQNEINLNSIKQKKKVVIVEQPQRVQTTYQKLLEQKLSKKVSPSRKKLGKKKPSLKYIQDTQKIFPNEQSTIIQESNPNFYEPRFSQTNSVGTYFEQQEQTKRNS